MSGPTMLAAVIGLLWVSHALPAFADVKDYEFQLVQSEMKKGAGTIVAVRLVNKKTGKTVPDAVIFAKRIDMAPDGMEDMQEGLERLPAAEPGGLSLQDRSFHGRPLAAFFGRKSPGRERHG
jgi:YtkA-like